MKVLIVAALIAVAAAAEYPAYPKPAYSKPTYPSPSYSAASYPKSYDYTPIPYNFAYAVKDEYYNDYAHQESGDDKGYVAGSYRVLLPDGRTQVVNYKADDYTGYVADVKYEGEAKYDYKPAYKPAAYPAPAYSAAPAYRAPAYRAPAYPSYPAPKYPAKY